MSNYISSTIRGGSVFIKGDMIHIERHGRKYKFPLKGSKNSISMSTGNDTLVINGHSYDLDNLEQYVKDPRLKQHKPRKERGIFSFFARLFAGILEVFD